MFWIRGSSTSKAKYYLKPIAKGFMPHAWLLFRQLNGSVSVISPKDGSRNEFDRMPGRETVS